MPNTYTVEIADEEDGPEAGLRARWAVCVARRLTKLEEEGADYPHVGGEVEILDAMEGKFVWEMTDVEFEQNPPTAVQLEILAVDPAQAPAAEGPVHVTARVPF